MTRAVTFYLAGPMQSWAGGPGCRFRPTDLRPTKRAVIGMVANALGRDRSDDISDLAALTFGVRTDRAGIVEKDFRVVGAGTDIPPLPGEVMFDPKVARRAAKHGYEAVSIPYRRAIAKHASATGEQVVKQAADASISHDYYLADAAFTVALTGDDDLVQRVADALEAPARVLFLGRRAYPVAHDLCPRVLDVADVADALAQTATIGGTDHDECVLSIEDEAGSWTPDQPTNFATRTRAARRERVIRPRTQRVRPDHEEQDFFTP